MTSIIQDVWKKSQPYANKVKRICLFCTLKRKWILYAMACKQSQPNWFILKTEKEMDPEIILLYRFHLIKLEKMQNALLSYYDSTIYIYTYLLPQL